MNAFIHSFFWEGVLLQGGRQPTPIPRTKKPPQKLKFSTFWSKAALILTPTLPSPPHPGPPPFRWTASSPAHPARPPEPPSWACLCLPPPTARGTWTPRCVAAWRSASTSRCPIRRHEGSCCSCTCGGHAWTNKCGGGQVAGGGWLVCGGLAYSVGGLGLAALHPTALHHAPYSPAPCTLQPCTIHAPYCPAVCKHCQHPQLR